MLLLEQGRASCCTEARNGIEIEVVGDDHREAAAPASIGRLPGVTKMTIARRLHDTDLDLDL